MKKMGALRKKLMYTHKNGITLRKMERDDLKNLKVLKDESWFGTHNIAIINMDEQKKWYESMISNGKGMVLIAAESERQEIPIGVYKISNLDWINGRYDSAHDVFQGARGKGFGKTILEAGVDFGFEVLNAHRIDTEVLENNVASKKCALFVGFQEEGVKRKCVHKCDQWLDSVFYGLLREDWRELERVERMDGVCNKSYQPKDGN